MKKVLPAVVLLLAFSGVMSAQNIPFPENEAIWKEEHLTFIGPVTNYFALCGDTTVNNIQYAQVRSIVVDSTLNVTSSSYVGGIRSSGGVVRFQPDFPVDERLLFDFDLQAGDTVELHRIYDLDETVTRTVDSTAVELLAGKMRKVIYFKPGHPSAPVEFWMEGIGSSYGLLGRAQDPGGDIGFSLLCYEYLAEYLNLTAIECFLPELEGCELTSAAEEAVAATSFSIFPNPATDQVRVQPGSAQQQPWALEILNLQGQVVERHEIHREDEVMLEVGHLPKGIYLLKMSVGPGRRVATTRKLVVL